MDPLDYKEKITKIFFVRHGQTKANKEGLIFGQWDLSLNKEGVKQAKQTAQKLTSPPTFDYIISSPLKRAKQTAKIISKKLKLKKIIIDKNLIEKSEGNWQKKNYWEIRKLDPLNYKRWLIDPIRKKPPGGESILELNKRVKKFQRKILNKYNGKNIIVVTHSGPIKVFILNLLKADISRFWHLKVDCGSITEVYLSKKHATIRSINLN